ncbi:hypothetical protein KA093_02990 [Candidatus Saccharibacteria bacterium]|nr:hypothetical protein [Candidatus Saccharibacteria bacterium]
MTSATLTQTSRPVSRWSNSYHLVTSAWRTLMLNKGVFVRLTLTPFLWTILIAVAITGIFANVTVVDNVARGVLTENNLFAIVFGAMLYLALSFIANYYAGATVIAALARFEGHSISYKKSMQAVRRHRKEIFAFSLLTSTVGYILQLIEERVPFAGKIATWLVGTAWAIASMFAVPVIVTSKQKVSALDAVRNSAGIIKKTWGENIIVSGGIAVVGVVAVVLYILLAAIIALTTIGMLGTGMGIVLPLVAIGIIGLFAIFLMLSVLGAIVKAAIFHYATSGRTPKAFDTELLRASFTTKKARGVFSV